MNEWTIVTVLIALVGLFITVGKPIITLNSNITKLTVTVDNLQKSVDRLEEKQRNDNTKVWDRLTSDDKRLDNHENRITKLEGSR